jgi:hypothetical protein
VNGLRLIGVDSRLSGAFGTAGDKGRFPVCQGKMETSARSLWEILANSGSVICETECKIISGLAAEEYLDEQHFLNDNAELGKQVRNGVWAISSPEQKGAAQIGEPEDHRCFSLSHLMTVFDLFHGHINCRHWFTHLKLQVLNLILYHKIHRKTKRERNYVPLTTLC